MAVGYALHQGHRCTDHAVARRAWRADLGLHSGLSDVGRIML